MLNDSVLNRGGQRRSAGLDILRVLAVTFVVGSHFFLNTKFNQTNFSSASMFVLGMLQTLTMANVPLFLMLTGYLNLNKRLSRSYYRAGVRVVVSYLVISAITIAFRILWKGEHMSALQWLLSVTSFRAINYAWYIEMWIGLFILTPFLNVLWHNLESRRHRQVLIATLFTMTALPNFFNRYGIELVPEFWTALFPLTYYFLGAYVREYQPTVNRRWLVLGILAICLVNPLINIVVASHRPMLHLIGDGVGIFGVPMTVMMFMLFYKCDIRSGALRAAVAKVSVLSLDIYLFSWIFDQLMYPLFSGGLADLTSLRALAQYPVVVVAITGASFVASWIKETVFEATRINRLMQRPAVGTSAG